MEDHKSLIKIISSYILGLFVLFTIFPVYLYFVEHPDFKYFILRLLDGNLDSWMVRSYVWGLIIPGLLNIFYFRHIKKLKVILVPIISTVSLFFSIVLGLQIGVTQTEMIGLGGAILFSLVLPVHLIFIIIYYFLYYKVDYKYIYSIFLKKSNLLFLLIFSIFISFSALAYSPHYTHPDLTEEIAKLFNFKNTDSDIKISANEIRWMREGAVNEDTPPRWINHFYDPENKVGWQGKHFGDRTQEQGLFSGESMAPKPAIASNDWVTNQEYQSAYGRQYGNQTWQKAIKSYIDGDKRSAFIALGHILHLIEDASVPDHTRNDTHADLFGDPGSPYEDYSKEYTNFNKLTVAENLKNNNFLYFSTIQDAFEYLATYSNNNFFSEDTISNEEYALPNLKDLQKKNGYLYDGEKKLYLAKEDIDKFNIIYTTNDESFVLPFYFYNLSAQAVSTGAGVLDLFFREVEKYKNNPELLPKIIQDSNEATLSYLKKSPRLAAVSTWDSIDKASTNTKIYIAALSSFFGNFSNLLPAQLSGLINTNAQPEGQRTAQAIPQSLPEQALQPVTAQPQPEAEAVIVVDPIAYEVPIVPVVVNTPSTQDAPQDIAQDMPVDPSVVLLVEVVETPASELLTSDVVNSADLSTATTTTPVYHGSGYVSGVSPDALAVVPPEEDPIEPLSFFAASTTADTTVTSTDSTATSTDSTATSTSETVSDAATSTEGVIETATSTEPVIAKEPEIIDGPAVVINEIAWMGTKAHHSDEWIELYNKTNSDIDLSEWTLESRNQKFSVALSQIIPAKGYFLLERTAITTTDQQENMIFTGAIADAGPEANLYLKNGTTTVDHIDFGYWLFASQKEERRSLERVSPYASSANRYNWKLYSEALTPPFAKDAEDGDLLGTPGAKNSVAGYYTPAESMAQDTVWRKAYSPYYVPPFALSIVNNATLTIEPGVVVKFASGGGMEVHGVLRAEGTMEEPIIFTSFSDDTVDGIDSNQDGSATKPNPADWANIHFYNTTAPSVVSYAHIKYGGHLVNGRVVGALTISGAYPHITDSVFDKNYMTSLYIEEGAHPFIARNTIKNTVAPEDTYSEMYYGSGIRIADASSTANIIGNIFEDNRIGISSESATSTSLIVKDNTFARNQKNGEFNRSYGDLNLENTNNQDSERKGGFYIYLVARDGQVKTLHADTMPYILRNGIAITEDGTLTIEPGVVIKSATSVPVVVWGTLKAQGDAERPIIFTTFADDSDGYDSDGGSRVLQPGAWENIQFIGATSSDSVLKYVSIRYGGSGENLCPYAYLGGPCMEYKGAVFIQDASPTIAHTTFDKNLAISVYVEGDAQPTIEYSDIRDTKEAIKNPRETIGGIGINIGAESAPVLTDNTFTNNNEDVVYRP